MTVRDLVASDLNVLGTSVVTISTATTTSFDFGTPADIDLSTVTAGEPGVDYQPGDKVLVVFSGSTAGTTDSLTFVVQDADDNAGDIGTPATAVTEGTLALGTGNGFSVVGVRLQPGRPWLRCRVTSSGATDTFVTHCTVLGVPQGML